MNRRHPRDASRCAGRATPFRIEELRAWIRRPDALRVDTVDGQFRQVVHESPTTVVPRPVLRSDGLVDVRPPDLSYDAPMYRDYLWVAMLDPVEFADGGRPDGALLRAPVLVLFAAALEGDRPP